jgi:hypothetical protein
VLSCSSKALAGDLPDGNLCNMTSNTFAFIILRHAGRVTTLAG